MSDWLEDFLSHVTAPDTARVDIFHALATATRRAGFEYCSLGLRQPATEGNRDAWWTTYPDAWREYYFKHEFLQIDPVIHAALGSNLAVVWNDPVIGELPEFWEPAMQHGIRHGWTLALRSRSGELGVISLARSSEVIMDAERFEKEPRLLWLVHAAMEAFAQIEDDHPVVEELTPRECDILRWALAGKTAEETAIILGITARTVNFHVAEINRKLGVVNKTQAVARALALNLLT